MEERVHRRIKFSRFIEPVTGEKPRSNALRLCTNLVRCNKECQQVDEKLPTLEQGLSKLGKKKVFIDLRQGFWQLPVVKEARKYLAFKTPSGLFQWTVMPFGLKTAPALFTKAIRKLLSAQFGDEAFKKMMGNAQRSMQTTTLSRTWMISSSLVTTNRVMSSM
jgi:hypothetical protein